MQTLYCEWCKKKFQAPKDDKPDALGVEPVCDPCFKYLKDRPGKQ